MERPMPELVAAYSVALISLLVFVLVVLLQSALVGAAKAKANMTPGSNPEPDYDNSVYRLNRSHQNGIEIMPAVAVGVFACILTGVSAWWVNLLMVLFLVLRLIYVLIYAQNVGKATQGARTFVFVAGWAMVVALCVLSILALV
ncbi:MAPEG family protein [Parasedimentitalea maritima]|uniref:MAPEG family protein n=1 Tax=Parasedimentitalea maritima TaxID=2578117 RepID=A0A6A4RHU4_9RHOB|nr:MAPEG family protein [Zongyanglinia marina]